MCYNLILADNNKRDIRLLWHTALYLFAFQEEFFMKKVLVILLALAVAGGVFAQAEVSGYVSTNFGLLMDLGIEDVDDSSYNDWIFGMGDAKIGASFDAGAVSGNVTYQAAGGSAGLDGANIAVDLGAAVLSTGYAWLPWVQWSAVNFRGNNNYNIGASAVKDIYIQAKFGSDDLSIYAGLAQQDVDGALLKDFAVFPGFYFGADFGGDGFNVGAAFLGAPRGKDWDPYPLLPEDPESRFFWMGNLHCGLDLDPLSIGLNVALYGDPAVAGSNAASVSPGWALWPYYAGTPDDMIFEGCLSIGVGLDACSVGFALGMLTNLADEDKGGGYGALQIGLSADFDLGGGFTLTPGVLFNKALGDGIKHKGSLDIGLTFSYGF